MWCGGMTIGSSANVKMKGTYWIADGDFTINAGATIGCDCPNETDGVTIILTKKTVSYAHIKINGNADVQLRAPKDPNDPFRGVLIYQDRGAPTSTNTWANKLNGGPTMKLEGSLYFPKQGVEFTGNNSNAHTCTQIIARVVAFTGNAYIDNSACKAAGVEPVTVTQARLVE
jgi:hypothetical protein